MSIISNTTDYFTGAVEELRHVRWATRKQAVRLSVITLIFTFATSMAYGLVDFILGRVVTVLLHFA